MLANSLSIQQNEVSTNNSATKTYAYCSVVGVATITYKQVLVTNKKPTPFYFERGRTCLPRVNEKKYSLSHSKQSSRTCGWGILTQDLSIDVGVDLLPC